MLNSRLLLAITVLAGCGDSSAPNDTIAFRNLLVVPVTVATEGTVVLTLPAESFVTTTLPRGVSSVDWTATNVPYTKGFTLADDLGTTKLNIASSRSVELTNVVGSATYFAPRVLN